MTQRECHASFNIDGGNHYFEFFVRIQLNIGKLIIPLDRAHRTVLVTSIEHLEQVLGRIRSGITSSDMYRL